MNTILLPPVIRRFLRPLLLCVLASFAAALVQAQERARADFDFRLQQYPGATLVEDRTRQLKAEKSPNWLAVAAYHSDAELKEVVEHFKAQAPKTASPADSNPVLKSLRRDNWKIEERPLVSSYTIFGAQREVLKETPQLGEQEVRISFGVAVFQDSVVRVHLMSPYVSLDNSRVIPGTLIILVKEPLPGTQAPGAAEIGGEEKAYPPTEVTRKARILKRPNPSYSSKAREEGVSGTVVLKAIFNASGKVTNIRVVSGLPYGLSESAIKAARKIKFEPAIKDGRQVSQFIQIEYNFNLY